MPGTWQDHNIGYYYDEYLLFPVQLTILVSTYCVQGTMLATEHSKMGETRVLLEKGSVNDSDACCGYSSLCLHFVQSFLQNPHSHS